jgi:NADH-quinone oxidoreductase subunit E
MNAFDSKRVDEIIDRYRGQNGVLIQLLLDLQSEMNWIPKEVVFHLSERLRIPSSQIFRIASFYRAINLSPAGRHTIQVCMGTACQVRGAEKILNFTESRLKIKAGETTSDMAFSLKKVNCLGCCSMGPLMTVDDQYHGRMTFEAAEDLLKNRVVED